MKKYLPLYTLIYYVLKHRQYKGEWMEKLAVLMDVLFIIVIWAKEATFTIQLWSDLIANLKYVLATLPWQTVFVISAFRIFK